jgi:hypothetical protein
LTPLFDFTKGPIRAKMGHDGQMGRSLISDVVLVDKVTDLPPIPETLTIEDVP